MDVLRPMRPARGLQLWNSETHSAFSFPDLEDRPGRAPGSWRSRVGAPEAAALAMASRNQLADKTGLLPPKPRNHAEVHRIHAESPSQPKTSEINPSFTKEFGDISARQQTRADLTGSSCGVKRERERESLIGRCARKREREREQSSRPKPQAKQRDRETETQSSAIHARPLEGSISFKMPKAPQAAALCCPAMPCNALQCPAGPHSRACCWTTPCARATRALRGRRKSSRCRETMAF